MLFSKCKHEWEEIDEYYTFDLYSDTTMPPPRIKVVCYQCKKCMKTKKRKFW